MKRVCLYYVWVYNICVCVCGFFYVFRKPMSTRRRLERSGFFSHAMAVRLDFFVGTFLQVSASTAVSVSWNEFCRGDTSARIQNCNRPIIILIITTTTTATLQPKRFLAAETRLNVRRRREGRGAEGNLCLRPPLCARDLTKATARADVCTT